MNGSDRGLTHCCLPNGNQLKFGWIPRGVVAFQDKEEQWDSGHIWTTDQFAALNFCSNPIWFFCHKELRPLWLNKSAQKRFKRQQHQLLELDFEKLKLNGDQEMVKQVHVMISQFGKLLEEDCKSSLYMVGPDKLLTPWWAVQSDAPGIEVCMKLRLIRLSLENSHVQNACMLQIVQELSTDQMRAVSMHHKNPLFTFMFDKKGKLLSLNMTAQQKYSIQSTTLLDLIKQGIYEGGPVEAQLKYEEAISTVIDKQQKYAIYVQRKSSKHPGEFRWLLLEMWPLDDPVTEQRAILVAMYNVTKLMSRQESLKRDREAMQSVVEKERGEKERLRTEKVELEAANQELQQEREQLQQQMEEMLSGDVKLTRHGINTQTPVDKTLDLIEKLMQGTQPDYNELKQLYDTMSGQKDLRQPANLGEQLMESEIDNEVSLSILQLLTDTVLEQFNAKTGSDEEMSDKESIQSGSSGNLYPHPQPQIYSEVERILSNSQSWDFDPFELHQASEGRPLSILGFFFIKRSGLTFALKLNEGRLAQFLRRIEEGYPDNPYHNRIHATDVLHKTDMLIRCSELMECGTVDQVGLLACLLSAVIHDFEHKGVNNDFLIRTRHFLAIRYNDKSPLENHHLAASFHLLYLREYNFLGSYQTKEFHDKLRGLMIDLVLATDMKQHFSILSRFQSLKFSNGYSLTRQRSSSSGAGDHERPSPEQFRQLEDSSRTLILQVALKMADIGHLSSKKDLHIKWVKNLEEEFFQQGDLEKTKRLQISPLMDRRKSGITLSQVGFFEIVALPLFQGFAQIFGGAQPMLEQVTENYQHWVEIENNSKS